MYTPVHADAPGDQRNAADSADPRAQSAVLRLLSCNILAGARVQHYHEYVTRSWASVLPTHTKLDNLDQLAGVLPSFDLIGLQEADAGSLRSGFRNQTRYLAEASGMPYWSYQPNRTIGRLAQTANGLISRYEPEEVLNYPLPGRIPGRGLLLARFRMGDESLAVAVGHLSLGMHARVRQLDFIADLLSDHPRAILMGDLNTDIDSLEMQRLFRRTRLQPPSRSHPTFPSWRPHRALDHILASEGLEVERTWTLAAAFSDHLATAAEVRLPAQNQQHRSTGQAVS